LLYCFQQIILYINIFISLQTLYSHSTGQSEQIYESLCNVRDTTVNHAQWQLYIGPCSQRTSHLVKLLTTRSEIQWEHIIPLHQALNFGPKPWNLIDFTLICNSRISFKQLVCEILKFSLKSVQIFKTIALISSNLVADVGRCLHVWNILGNLPRNVFITLSQNFIKNIDLGSTTWYKGAIPPIKGATASSPHRGWASHVITLPLHRNTFFGFSVLNAQNIANCNIVS